MFFHDLCFLPNLLQSLLPESQPTAISLGLLLPKKEPRPMPTRRLPEPLRIACLNSTVPAGVPGRFVATAQSIVPVSGTPNTQIAGGSPLFETEQKEVVDLGGDALTNKWIRAFHKKAFSGPLLTLEL